MPIYEFYCPDCNTVFSFFSAKVETERRPDCPRCRRPDLDRRPSRFATLSSLGVPDGDQDPLAGVDEGTLERAMEALADGVGESEDPRRLASALRGFGKESGLSLGPKMEAMLGRLEAGEDIETLEAEMQEPGDDSVEDYFRLKRQLTGADHRKPRRDEELYFF